MTIVVTGDRHWKNATRIRNVLFSLKAEFGEFLLIEGGAPGADLFCRYEALALGLKCLVFEANWAQLGRAAGPTRNRTMLSQKPDLVVAFHNDLTSSRGTKDCVTEAKRRGIPVRGFSETGEWSV